MSSISPSERAALIIGLRTLADYLEGITNAPHCAEVMLLPVTKNGGSEYAVACVDAQRVIQTSAKGVTAVPFNFGPVTYKVTLATHSGER